jgi:hypothetical protein
MVAKKLGNIQTATVKGGRAEKCIQQGHDDNGQIEG